MEIMMPNQITYFLRGVFRLGTFAIILGLVVLAFNVIGHISLTYDLIFWTDSSALPYRETYLGRVLTLALVGLFQSVLCLGITAVAGAILFFCYYGIIYIGGYRATEDNAC